jgi:ketosteroid isomerase-like protein
MKAQMLVPGLLILCLACASQQSDQLTQQQQDRIKSEIKAVTDSFMGRWQRMDVEGALQYYSPDFVCFGSGGKRVDLQGYKKENTDLFKSATAYKWTSYREDFIVITKDTVVCAWDGKNEVSMKSGETIAFDPSHYTFAFKRIAGQWRLAYHHFSGTLVGPKADTK